MSTNPYDALIDGPGGTGELPPSNPYDEILEQEDARRRAIIRDAVGVNADQAARAGAVGRQAGVPPDVALRNLTELEAKQTIDRIEGVSKQSASLRALMQDQGFARVAHDDVENLSALEQGFRTLKSIPRAVASAFPQAGAGLYGAAAAPFEVAGQGFRAAEDAIADLMGAPRGMGRNVGEAIGGALRAEQQSAKAVAGEVYTPPKDAGIIERGVGSGFQSAAQTLLTLPIALREGGANAALAFMGLVSGGLSYGEARDKGLAPAQAAVFGVEQGVAEAVTERLPLGKLLGDIEASTGAGKMLVNNLLRELPGELAATTWQSFNEWLTLNPDKSLADWTSSLPEDLAATVVGTLVGGSAQTAVIKAVQAGASRASKSAQQADDANRTAEAFKALDKLVTASKVRERSPDNWQSFWQEVTRDGPVPDVYIDARELDEGTLRKLVEVSPAAAQQAAESLASGVDMQIPAAEFGASVAGQPFAQAIIPHLKTDPNGMSKAQADEAFKSAPEDQRTAVVESLARADRQDTFERSRSALEARFLEQLNATGRTAAEANKPQAALLAARYAALGSRLGITPEAAFERMPVTIGDQASGGALEQATLVGITVEPTAEGFRAVDAAGKVVGKLKSNLTPEQSRQLDETANIDYVEVDKAMRGTGVGSALYAAFDRAHEGRVAPSGKTTKAAWAVWKRNYPDKVEAFVRQEADRIKGGADAGLVIGNITDPEVAQGVRDALAGKASAFYLAQGERPVGPRGPQQPVVRGQFIPSTQTIALLKDANLSTFIHETGHLFLDQMGRIAAMEDAPADVKADMDTLLQWFGVEGGVEVWNRMELEQQRDHHERFARGFEAYALEGKSPSVALAGAFRRFRGWLRRLYGSISGLNVPLTDEVRAVMDRMVATDEEIQQAKAAQSMGLMFTPEDAAKLGIDYRALQATDQEATDDAATELDARRLADLKWFDNARSKALRALQRQAKELRIAVTAEVTEEVDASPTERARRALDEMSAADPATVERLKEWTERREAEAERARDKVKAEILSQNTELAGLERAQLINSSKAEIAAAVERDLRAWDAANQKPQPDMTPLDFDAVADTVGFASGEEMLRTLAEAPRRLDLISAMTDQRMLEQYGDITDPQELQQAAIEAVYNQARVRVVSTELSALEKAAGVRTKTVTKAAKAFAAQVVGRQKVGELKPEKFEAAAAKAARASLKAFKAGDIAKAAAEKRNELVNTFAAREARERKNAITKKVSQYQRSVNKSIKDLAKTRDADMVQAMRAILAEYGIGNKGDAAQKYLDALKAHDPDTHTRLAQSIDAMTAGAKDYRLLSVDDFRALADDLDAMWALSGTDRKMVIDGDLIDKQEATDALKARIEALGVPGRIPGEGYAVTEAEKLTALLRSARAGLRRVESWVNAQDGGMVGPFRKYVWNPIKDASDKYRAAQAKHLKRYRFLLSGVDLGKARIAAPELGYTFGFSRGGSGKQEILHAILHTGNASNKRKLLLGRNWGQLTADGGLDTSRWDAFLQRMIDQGVITKNDMDFVQGVWDLLEETKVGAQQTHREVFGRSFDEVVAEPVQTPWGEYRGGYVPAMADPDAVSDAKTRGILEEENQTMAHAFPSTPKGFTKARVEYNRPLMLDLRTLSSHIDKVLMFTHLEKPVRDVRRVLGDDAVRTPLSRIDSSAYDGMLTPWLNRAARQQVETPVPGYNGLFKYFTRLRSRAGMAAMFANVVNTAQQITGFSLAALRVRPRLLASALVEYTKNPHETARRVAESSQYMASRMDNEISLMNQAIDDILLNPNVYQKAQAWTARHAYFLQAAADNVMGPIIWTGAYNQAIESGANELDARRQADSAVRETQGSNLPEDVANFEAGTPFVRLFTQFQGYFNMQANLLGTEFAKTQRELGLRAGMGRGLYIFTLGFLAPAIVSQIIVEAGRGGPDDEDDDGYLDDWLASLGLGAAKSAWALIPVVGPVANVVTNSMNNKPYDDRISTAPAISMIEAAGRSPASVYSAVAGEGSARKAVKDVASLISITTGLPAYAIARPAGYLADVMQGRVEPTGPVDAVRGTITGTPSAASR